MNITLKTNHPVAYESPDHLMPWGTMRDNSTNIKFIDEIHDFFKSNFNLDKINFLDLGCSGGQLVVDFHDRGNLSVGLEGSDYSVKHQRANWPEWYNKILFTCDVTKPYELYLDNEKIYFDLISAWEVIEHIHPDDLKVFFKHISDNLNPNGIFVGSVSTKEDVIQGHVLHQSVFSEIQWYTMLPKLLEDTSLKLYKYPFKEVVRGDWGSFHILLIKENT